MNAPDKLPLNTASTKAAAGQSHFHESARAQVAGAVNYIDDIPEVKGTLFAAPILSNVAHGRLLGVDARITSPRGLKPAPTTARTASTKPATPIS
jgi:xanthine dehydrogenase large subunit